MLYCLCGLGSADDAGVHQSQWSKDFQLEPTKQFHLSRQLQHQAVRDLQVLGLFRRLHQHLLYLERGRLETRTVALGHARRLWELSFARTMCHRVKKAMPLGLTCGDENTLDGKLSA